MFWLKFEQVSYQFKLTKFTVFFIGFCLGSNAVIIILYTDPVFLCCISVMGKCAISPQYFTLFPSFEQFPATYNRGKITFLRYYVLLYSINSYSVESNNSILRSKHKAFLTNGFVKNFNLSAKPIRVYS